jgi:hypothetical protein
MVEAIAGLSALCCELLLALARGRRDTSFAECRRLCFKLLFECGRLTRLRGRVLLRSTQFGQGRRQVGLESDDSLSMLPPQGGQLRTKAFAFLPRPIDLHVTA